MTPVQRQEIFNNLRRVIEEEGSARVGWAIHLVMGKDHQPAEHEIEKISAAMIQSSEYDRSRKTSSHDYYIFKNPQFDLNQNIKKTNESSQHLNKVILPDNFKSQKKFGNRSILLAFMSVLFIGLTLYVQWKDNTSKELQQIRQELKKVRESLDSIKIQASFH